MTTAPRSRWREGRSLSRLKTLSFSYSREFGTGLPVGNTSKIFNVSPPPRGCIVAQSREDPIEHRPPQIGAGAPAGLSLEGSRFVVTDAVGNSAVLPR